MVRRRARLVRLPCCPLERGLGARLVVWGARESEWALHIGRRDAQVVPVFSVPLGCGGSIGGIVPGDYSVAVASEQSRRFSVVSPHHVAGVREARAGRGSVRRLNSHSSRSVPAFGIHARRRPRIDDLSASSMSSERRTKASSTECASGRCELCDGGCWAGRCAGSAETRGMSSCWRSVRRRCGESPVGYGGRVHGILHGDRHGVAVHQCGRMIAASFRLLLAGVRDARCARAHCMSSQQPAMPKRGLFWLGSVGRRVNWRRWSHPVSVSKTPGLKLVCLRRGLAGWRARRIPVAVML